MGESSSSKRRAKTFRWTSRRESGRRFHRPRWKSSTETSSVGLPHGSPFWESRPVRKVRTAWRLRFSIRVQIPGRWGRRRESHRSRCFPRGVLVLTDRLNCFPETTGVENFWWCGRTVIRQPSIVTPTGESVALRCRHSLRDPRQSSSDSRVGKSVCCSKMVCGQPPADSGETVKVSGQTEHPNKMQLLDFSVTVTPGNLLDHES
jgi:hypothetical protein